MWGDPYAFADAIGVTICWLNPLPFLVGSSGGDIAFMRWDADPCVREDRAWEGVAQCLMTRAGLPWGEVEPARFAKKLRGIDASEISRLFA